MKQEQAIRQEAFEDMQLSVIEQDGEEWFGAEDIGKALGFSEPRKAVLKIYERNADEFEGLRRVVKLTTWLKSGLKSPYRFTTFNPQGAYLLAILAGNLTKKLTQVQKQLEATPEGRFRGLPGKIPWHIIPKIPDWFWDVNDRIQTLEQRIKKLEAAPTGKLAVIPEDLVLITAKDLRRLRDMGGAEAQRIMHDTLSAQAKWDALVKGRLN